MNEVTSSMAESKKKPDGETAGYKVLRKDQRRYLFLKRAIDIVISAVAVVLFAVPMLLIALTLKILYPRTPVLFRQKRVGRNGEIFTLVKFSSMKKDAPQNTRIKEHPGSEKTITAYGHFLRSTSLDELPQLFQVLSGKMSLIGPRPLILQEKKMHAMRWDAGVYQLRPGMTGWAQVNGRNTLKDDKKLAYDREYLEKMGLSMDWEIFWMTFKKVICREGVDER